MRKLMKTLLLVLCLISVEASRAQTNPEVSQVYVLFKTRFSKTVTNRQMGESFSVRLNPYLPSAAYNAIKLNNPQGYTVKRKK